MPFQYLNLLRVVPAVLHLTDVGTSQEELTRAALADAAADGLGESAVKKHPVPNELLSLRNMTQIQLLEQYLGVDADAHRRQFKRLLKDGVPHQEISVETKAAIGTLRDPIVVIRSAAVMAELSILLHSTDTDKENGLVLLAQDVLAFLGSRAWGNSLIISSEVAK